MRTINSNRLHALFQNMVDIYSPSGKEGELTDFLENVLAASGLAVERQSVDESRSNLLISSGTGKPERLFLGHIDTVPAYDIEQYGFSEKEGVCHGLGTADMKSGCAAMIEAFMGAAEQGVLPSNVLLALRRRHAGIAAGLLLFDRPGGGTDQPATLHGALWLRGTGGSRLRLPPPCRHVGPRHQRHSCHASFFDPARGGLIPKNYDV
jgi:hypothetical protein